jgi:hypothetical protein
MIGGILYSLTSPEFNATAKKAPSIDSFASLGKLRYFYSTFNSGSAWFGISGATFRE